MSLDPLEMLLRAFYLPTMAAMYETSLAPGRSTELGLQALSPAPVRERGAGSSGTPGGPFNQGLKVSGVKL